MTPLNRTLDQGASEPMPLGTAYFVLETAQGESSTREGRWPNGLQRPASDYDFSGYVEVFDFATDEWVAIRRKNYPPESVNPSGAARFHHIGQPAYYAASGIQTARAEVFSEPLAEVPHSHEVYSFPPGRYTLFNVDRFVEEHSEASGLLNPNDHTDGQRLREALERMSCSGVMYPSVRYGGGINASVWPLAGTPLQNGTFFRTYDGPR